MQPNPAYTFRADLTSGRFHPIPAEGSLGDGTIVVSGAPDQHSACSALHAGAAVPVPAGAKFTVTYVALTAAIQAGTRAVVTPWTY